MRPAVANDERRAAGRHRIRPRSAVSLIVADEPSSGIVDRLRWLAQQVSPLAF